MARILAVEDETDLCELLKEELESEGHEVRTANNGDQALRVLQSFVPEIVISDVSMPGMDGFGLLEEFRTSYPALADTPFLFLTALRNREDEIRARECGVDDYLTKPIDFDLLHSVLATRLRQVARMRERKEQQMVKLYKALSNAGDDAAAHTAMRDELGVVLDHDGATGSYGETFDDAAADAAPETRSVFVSLFRFPNLKRVTRNVPGADATFRQRTIGRALEILKGLVCDLGVVSSVDDESLVVSYPDADEARAGKLSARFGSLLQDKVLEDQRDIWKSEFKLDEETIAQALIVSEALFEITLSPDDCTPEEFEQAVYDAIEKTRANPRAPTSLVSSIEADEGDLTPLKMIARDGSELPIRFFNYDERSKRKLRAAFTFFGNTNREKAGYLVDVMTLDLMEHADNDLGKSDIAVVDVHYRTLASRIYGPTFVRKFLQFAKDVPYSFMLNVRSVPSKFSAADFNEILRPLGKYASRRSVQVEPDKIAAIVRSKVSVSCLVCSHHRFSSSPEVMRAFREIRPALSRSGTLLVLRGLDSEDNIERVTDFGFDGYAIDGQPTAASEPG